MEIVPVQLDEKQRGEPPRDTIAPSIHLRVTLADILAAITICAVGLAVTTQVGYELDRFPEEFIPRHTPYGVIEGLLTSGGLALVFLAFRMRGWKWPWSVLMLLSAVLLVWFAAVDLTVDSHYCEHCHRHRIEAAYRLYRWRIRPLPTNIHSTMTSDVAADLGVPCQHHEHSFQKLRFWGLVYPYPALSGICCLSGDVTYEELRPAVQEMLSEDPELPKTFRQKVLYEHDSNYTQQFYSEAYQRLESWQD